MRTTAERLNAVRASGGRLIAVGTTSLRLLESAAGRGRAIRPFEGDTAIFITPGYRFRAVDGLITNFHLPRSTLFMLVSALMGLEVMKAAYAHAIERGVPLLLLWRREPAASSDREITPEQPRGQAERDDHQQRADQLRAEADRAVAAEPAARPSRLPPCTGRAATASSRRARRTGRWRRCW